MKSENQSVLKGKKCIREKYFKCYQCGYKCTNHTHLKRHELLHTSQKFHKCLSCDFVAETAYDLTVHGRTHTSPNRFTCTHCDHWSTRKTNLTLHMIMHTGEKERQRFLKKCPNTNCGYKTIHASSLSAHVKVHSEEKPFACTKCEYSSKWPVNLKTHMRVHAGKEEREQLMRACTYENCSFKTVYAGDLDRHLWTHSKLKPLKRQRFRRVYDRQKVRIQESEKAVAPKMSPSNFSLVVKEEMRDDDVQVGASAIFKTDTVCFQEEGERDDFKTCPDVKAERSEWGTLDLSEPNSGTQDMSAETGRGIKKRIRMLDGLHGRKIYRINSQRVPGPFQCYHCKRCSYQTDDNMYLALHNEVTHRIPFVALQCCSL